MKHDAPPPKKQGRRIVRFTIRFIIGLLAAFLVVWWWHYAPPPTSGGGRPDGFFARRLKQRAYAAVAPLDEADFIRSTPENLNSWHNTFAEQVQTLGIYQASNPTRPTKTRRVLVLQPIGPFNAEQDELLHDVGDFCAAYFQLPVRIEKPLGLEICTTRRASRAPNPAAAVGHEQYEAPNFIDKLSKRLPSDATAYLGVTMADLWASDLSFVFGQGDLYSRSGVYSLCRYFPEFWNQPRRPGDDKLILRRSCQVLAHETGHMFGLSHCVFYKCVMNGSNSLHDADAEPLDFCPICHRKILWNLGCDGTKRYTDLLAFYRKHGLDSEAKWTAKRLKHWKELTEKKPEFGIQKRTGMMLSLVYQHSSAERGTEH